MGKRQSVQQDKTLHSPQEELSEAIAIPTKTGEDRRLSRWLASHGDKLRYLAYFAIFLAVLRGFWFVERFGDLSYRGDSWEVNALDYQHYIVGKLTLNDFWRGHNEHRITIPQLIMFGIGLLTHGDSRVILILTQLLNLAMLLVFIAAFRERFKLEQTIWLMAPVAFLLFSFRHWENTLTDFQFTLVFANAAALSVFWLLWRMDENRCWKKFGCAAIAATVASYSLAHGLFVWPVGLLQIAVLPLPKKRRGTLATIWIAIALLEWSVYFLVGAMPLEQDRIAVKASLVLPYFFALVGGVLFDNAGMAMVAGVLILILMMVALTNVALRRQWSEQSFWLAVLAFSLMTMASIVVGRSSFGVGQALSSRYALYSSPFLIAIYVLLLPKKGEAFRKISVLLSGVTVCLLVFGITCADLDGLQLGGCWNSTWFYRRIIACTAESQPAKALDVICWPGPAPNKKDLLASIKAMRENKYNLFADADFCKRCQLVSASLPKLSRSTPCAATGISSAAFGTLIVIRGWAVDRSLNATETALAGGVTVVFDGVARPTYYGIPERDVCETLQSNRLLLSGFACPLAATTFTKGKHTFFLRILSNDGDGIIETPAKTIEIK